MQKNGHGQRRCGENKREQRNKMIQGINASKDRLKQSSDHIKELDARIRKLQPLRSANDRRQVAMAFPLGMALSISGLRMGASTL